MAGFWQRLKRLFRGSSARDDERDSRLPLALESAAKEADKSESERTVYESSGVVILEDQTLSDNQSEEAVSESAAPSSAEENTAESAVSSPEKTAEAPETAPATPAATVPDSGTSDSPSAAEPADTSVAAEEGNSPETPVEPVEEPCRKLPVHGVKTADICAANDQESYGVPAIDRTPGRKLILAFEKRPANGHTQVWYTRSRDHGISWEEPRVLFDQETYTDSGQSFTDPQIIISQVTGRVFIAVTTRSDDDESQNHIAVALSDDEGDTWRYRDLTSLVDGDQSWVSRRTAHGHGVQLRHGIWTGRLAYVAVATEADGKRGAVAVCSDDQGISWWAGKFAGEKVIQATITELSDGKLVMGCIEETDQGLTFNAYASADGGRSFTEKLDKKALGNTLPTAVERAFYSAPEHTEQSRVMLAVARNQNGQGTVRSMFDFASELLGVMPFTSQPVNTLDVVSLEDIRIVAIAYETDSGISVAAFCIDALSLKYLAVGWNATEKEQNQVLRRAGLLSRR
ncbi:exo-alpha-sialidase [Varibaculum cambriense]|uniref:exo-alpha-sialidase n=1 Tax=Varibaculum cambriense TaxID=184870 RepID=UPI00290D990F|nr:exo-alpha-sialidase [Varibaculum cambriense]MDU5542639.1 exo-alpha-sialidase [Varibaculum cambriense]